jgi:hypothetical protein
MSAPVLDISIGLSLIHRATILKARRPDGEARRIRRRCRRIRVRQVDDGLSVMRLLPHGAGDRFASGLGGATDLAGLRRASVCADCAAR